MLASTGQLHVFKIIFNNKISKPVINGYAIKAKGD